MVQGVERHIVLINGDITSQLASEHQGNVDIILALARREGLTTHVLEGKGATEAAFGKLMRRLQGRMDGDDELFIYITGHGTQVKGEEGFIVEGEKDRFFPLSRIDQLSLSLRVKKRAIWVDACQTGGALRYFSLDPKTLFVSAGSKDENVSCRYFTRPAFEAASNLETPSDGIITHWERFVAGAENVKRVKGAYQPIYYAGPEYVDNGFSDKKVKPRFPKEVLHVDNKVALESALESLLPGQIAIVDFSAVWCGPCKRYYPTFKEFAEGSDGRYLWIKAQAPDESHDSDWNEYGIEGFPTVKIFQHNDRVGYALDPKKYLNPKKYGDPTEEIPFALLSDDLRSKIKVIRLLAKFAAESSRGSEGLWDELKDLERLTIEAYPLLLSIIENRDRQLYLYISVEMFGKVGEDFLPFVTSYLKHKDLAIRTNAVRAIGYMGEKGKEVLPELIKMYATIDDQGITNDKKKRSLEAALKSAIKNIGKESPDFFLSLVGHKSWRLRDLGFSNLNLREDTQRLMPTYIAHLNDPSREVRYTVIYRIVRYPLESTVSPLVQRLNGEPDKELKYAIALALSKRGDERALPYGVEAVQDKDIKLSRLGIQILGNLLHPESISLLMELAEQENDDMFNWRSSAISILGDFRDPAYLLLFEKWILDESSSVRAAAVRALGQYESQDVIPHFESLAWSDKSKDVRRNAIEALGNLHRPESVAVLSAIVREEEDGFIRKDAVRALGKIGDPEGYAALIGRLKDSRDYVRKEAAYVLGELQVAEAVDELKVVIENASNKVRRMRQLRGSAYDKKKMEELMAEAFLALEKIGEPSRKVYRELAQNESAAVRTIHALATMPELGVSILLDLVDSANFITQYRIIYRLGDGKDKAIIPKLIEFLGHKEKYVRQTAYSFLKKFGKAAMPALIEGLKSENLEDGKQKANIEDLLVIIGKDAVEPLVQFVLTTATDETLNDAINAAGVLMLLGTKALTRVKKVEQLLAQSRGNPIAENLMGQVIDRIYEWGKYRKPRGRAL